MTVAWVSRVRLAALAAALCAVAGGAAGAELRGGVIRQDFKDLWAAPAEYERAWALNAEIGFAPLFTVLGGDFAPFAGATWAPGDNVDKLYGGLAWEFRLDTLFLRAGVGGVVHNGKVNSPTSFGTRRQFGSRVLFHVPVEIGVRVAERTRVSLYFDHMSNAKFSDFNPGMDSLGIRVGWSF